MAVWDISSATPTKAGSLTNANLDRPLGATLCGGNGYLCIPLQGDIGGVGFVNVKTPATPAYDSRVLQPVAGGTPSGDPGSAELYHSFRAVVMPDDSDYVLIAVAGSGHLTFLKLNAVYDHLFPSSTLYPASNVYPAGTPPNQSGAASGALGRTLLGVG
jgi:hypothetical protein